MISSIDTKIRVAYIVVYLAMVIFGVVADMTPWLATLVGVLAVVPVVVADIIVSRRRRGELAATSDSRDGQPR